ncbi:MAG: sodium:solute symporter [Alphaproteobacteria bacterium]|nr:sodium:solute symporter [Alphaproteobacteria bacterium]
MDALAVPVALALLVYLVGMLALGVFVRERTADVEGYVVAGRRLDLGLATPTLLATWFGAGTLLAATDAVRAEGLRAAALDPFGAGLCLVLAGLWLARPLWRMRLLTLPDFYARTYGTRAEVAAAVVMVPGYLGWIAAQLVALSTVVELYLGLPHGLALPLVAVAGVAYTLVGGMWAVTLTDAVQMALVVVGVLVLGAVTLAELGDGGIVAGWTRLVAETPAAKARVLPEAGEVLPWLSLLAAGALGNLPGQDLTQRIFAARSERVAQVACLLAGGLYLAIGTVPLAIGLAADLLLPEAVTEAILPALAHHLLHPAVAVVLVVTVISAVLSTLDSAILAPASVIAHNLWGRGGGAEHVARYRWAVGGVAAAALGLASLGQSAWDLLQTAYEASLVGLLVPLLGGLWWPGRSERAALAALGAGTGVWALHLAGGYDTLAGTPVPIGLAGLGCSALAFLVVGLRDGRQA